MRHDSSEPFINRTELSLCMPDIKLSGSAELDHFLTHHLSPLSDPADGAGQGKDHGEHVAGDLERLEDDAGVEIDVGVQFTLLEIIIIKCCLF